MAHRIRSLITARFPRTRALVAALLVFGTAILPGFAGPDPASAERTVHFTVFSAESITGLTYRPDETAAPEPVIFYPSTRSPRYAYRGTLPLGFHEAGSAIRVAEVTLPPEWTEVLLIFERQAASPDGPRYRVHVLDDGAGVRPRGSLAIVNLSGRALSGTIGGREVTIREGLSPSLAVGRTAKVRLQTLFKGVRYQAYADTLELKENERALLILFPPYYPGSLELQSRLLTDQ